MSYQPTEAELLSYGFEKTVDKGSSVWVKAGLYSGQQAFLYIDVNVEGWNECSVFVADAPFAIADMGVDNPDELRAAVDAFSGKGAHDCRFACTDEGGCIAPFEWVKIRDKDDLPDLWSEPLHYCQQAIQNDRACGYEVVPTNPF
jgi:hypothetical protein